MVPRDLDIGFQGLALIQGQIYNPNGNVFRMDGMVLDVFFLLKEIYLKMYFWFAVNPER